MSRAFTLVELLIVCSVILTLAGITCASFGAIRRSCVGRVQRAAAPLSRLGDTWPSD